MNTFLYHHALINEQSKLFEIMIKVIGAIPPFQRGQGGFKSPAY